MTWLILGIVLVLLAAGVFVVVSAGRRATTGDLSRETRKKDASASTIPPGAELAPIENAEGEDGRARAEETRAIGSGSRVPVAAGGGGVALPTRPPIDEEELGATRRQFFNRAILIVLGGPVLATFGVSLLGFLWPNAAGGFGGKVKSPLGLTDLLSTITTQKQPYYVPEARTWVAAYPPADVGAAKQVYKIPAEIAGMEAGIVALYQKCVHLGCRVPWCQSSQWFECPCHGSKYNAVGEKRGGPAPRGLDRWPVFISGDSVTIDTSGNAIQGPPIGTNTTGQGAEGPFCV
ncbi:MAG: Rieske Fe-S protein [Acidimicrobiales bacterium]|nr:Rieske Fe-S protein [Acidimicrobiales bacterium]